VKRPTKNTNVWKTSIGRFINRENSESEKKGKSSKAPTSLEETSEVTIQHPSTGRYLGEENPWPEEGEGKRGEKITRVWTGRRNRQRNVYCVGEFIGTLDKRKPYLPGKRGDLKRGIKQKKKRRGRAHASSARSARVGKDAGGKKKRGKKSFKQQQGPVGSAWDGDRERSG